MFGKLGTQINTIAFYLGLYEEHILEIGFLLNDHVLLKESLEEEWLNNREIEYRLEAHIDALYTGGDSALKKCLDTLLVSDDLDEILGSVYAITLICSKDASGLLQLFELFQKAEDELVEAYIIGFKHSKISIAAEGLLTLLKDENPFIRAATAEILGYRGYRGDTDPHRIWPLFHDKDESVKTAAMVAVMRLGFKEAVPSMEQTVLENKEML